MGMIETGGGRQANGSIMEATLWMIGLSILLFWLPLIGPLIAGAVGGRRAGGIGPALLASLLPAVIAALLVFFVGTAFGLPVLAALAGTGILVVLAIEGIPLIVGALVGGATATR